METVTTTIATIDEYIAQFSPPVQQQLSLIRATIRAAAPTASEKISYAIPTFFLNGNLIHFAAYPHHLALYPRPSGIAEFEKDLANYPGGKGTIRFPLDAPLPLDLITRIVNYRLTVIAKKTQKTTASKKG